MADVTDSIHSNPDNFALVGMIYGELLSGVTAGWPQSEASRFFSDRSLSLASWPPHARALPVAVRRRIRGVGVHGINAQLACAWALNGPMSDDVAHWFIRGFEAGVWRNYPNQLMSQAHQLRMSAAVDLSDDTARPIGPIGVAVVALPGEEDDARRARVCAVMLSLYGDQRTATLAVLLSEVVAQLNRGGQVTIAGAYESVRGTFARCGLSAPLVDRLTPAATSRDRSRESADEEYWRVLDAMARAVSSQESPETVFRDVALEGGPSDTLGAAIGAIWATRFGLGWVTDSWLIDGDRILAVADGLSSKSLHDAFDSFLRREAELTREEQLLRDDLLAERRTSSRPI